MVLPSLDMHQEYFDSSKYVFTRNLVKFDIILLIVRINCVVQPLPLKY